MKERPILFSGPMVRAILGGRKMQTRRVMKVQPRFPLCQKEEQARKDLKIWNEYSENPLCDPVAGSPWGFGYFCPYEVEMRLWVRETWREWHKNDAECGCGGDYCSCSREPKTSVCYCADYHPAEISGDGSEYIKWRPSIFMPRWACRIVLEITDIRAERLQDISEEDARAEGVDEMTRSLISKYEKGWEPQNWLSSDAGPSYCRKCAEKALHESAEEDNYIDGGHPGASIETDCLEYCEKCGKMLESSPLHPEYYLADKNGEYVERPPDAEEVAMLASFNSGPMIDREVFRISWDSINGKRPGCTWESNPWVWAITFKRVQS